MKLRIPANVVRCCACRTGIGEARFRIELHWLKQRGRYRPVLCYRCVNRLWDLLNARVTINPEGRAVMPTVVVRKHRAEQAHRTGL